MTRISSLPSLLARSGGGPQPAPFPTNTSCIRAFASELSPVVRPHILARNHPARAEGPFDFNTPVAEQMLKHAHRPQTRVRGADADHPARPHLPGGGHGQDADRARALDDDRVAP